MKSILLAFILLSTTTIMAEEAPNTPATASVVKADGQTLDGVINKSLATVVEKIKETKGKVAVMDFPGLDGASTGLSAYVANKAGNKLIEVGRQVVDRSTLEKVISEQRLQQNSLMDAATATKVGKLAGAGVFIIGNYTKTDTRFVLTVRALSVELGQFIPGAVAEETVKPISKEFLDDLNELVKLNSQVSTAPILTLDSTSSKDSVEPASAIEIEFDNKVCKMIKQNLQIGKILKLAYDLKYLSLDEIKEITYSDEVTDKTGEYKGGIVVGNWGLANDGGTIGKSSLGTLVKGKSYPFDSGRSELKAWYYTGNNIIKKTEKCDNNGWWIK